MLNRLHIQVTAFALFALLALSGVGASPYGADAPAEDAEYLSLHQTLAYK
ncbi:hypothetical protein BJ138DRAFT_1129942 [Hygrophoropsis aurantiaca]|uniref:Uncharacterized protein n=1 Tax=Hygrophoropsis aurantiaca TaxID=72124 RepID=A0ACB7ZYQ4_9AGAM|nr:hypothetical protein BJ138DRAFT_1129942 [Hygrophoropsis aurantiaca]